MSWKVAGFICLCLLVLAVANPAWAAFFQIEKPVAATAMVTFRGDVNRDGKVDIFDLVEVSTVFNTVVLVGEPADTNRDGKVNILDLALVGLQFGKKINGGD